MNKLGEISVNLRNLILVVTLTSFSGAPLAASFDNRYSLRVGDLDGDGLQDIFVGYSPAITLVDVDGILVPVPATKSPTSEFILKQNSNGSFDLASSLTPAQIATARAWQRSVVPVVRGDFNADGNVDLMLKGLSSAIAGVVNPIVFSSPALGAAPAAVKSLDAQTSSFVDELSGWVGNQTYYQSGWYLNRTIEYDGYSWATFDCDGTFYPDTSALTGGSVDPVFGTPGGSGSSLPNGGEGCSYVGHSTWNNVIIEEWIFDESQFHPGAMSVARTLAKYRDGDNAFTLSAPDQEAIKQEFTKAFGVVFGTLNGIAIPDYPVPPALDWPWLRWISRANPLLVLAAIINAAFPNATADDDTFNLFHHYSYLHFGGSIAISGLWAPVFLTQGRVMTGQEAQTNLYLSGPIRDAIYFVQLPKSWPLSIPRPVLHGGEGWSEWISAQPIPPIYVSPPRALPASL